MPVTPQQVDQLVDQSRVANVIRQVDEKLSDPVWITNWRCGTGDERFWSVPLPETLSPGEKAAIKLAYQDAGWRKVVVTNSEDNGERVGMCSVTVYK